MRRTFLLPLLLLSCVLLLCARDKSPLGPGEPPAVCPQRTIPWPSLGESPWPVMGADPQSTHRSRHPGPRGGRVRWWFRFPDWTSRPRLALGPEGTIYVAAKGDSARMIFLYAFGPEGAMLWKRALCSGGPVSSPMVLPDGGVLVVADRTGTVFEFGPDGAERSWHRVNEWLEARRPGVGVDGTLYLVWSYAKQCVAIQRSGAVVWRNGEKGFGYGPSGEWISMSPGGEVLYLLGADPARPTSLVCLDAQTGALLWEAPASWYSCFPVVDCEGNIYYTRLREQTGYVLCSLTSAGVLRWESECAVSPETTVALGPDGSLYVRGEGPVLLCFDCQGRLKWSAALVPEVWTGQGNIMVDCEGTVYFAYPSSYVAAFDRYGRRLFTCELPGIASGLETGAISADRRLYLIGERELYCIE